jgi:alpha-N-arabinofuranosidase
MIFLRPKLACVLASLHAALIVISLSGCSKDRNDYIPAPPVLADEVITCRIDASKTLRTIPRTLYGTNLEWFNRANGMVKADGTIDPKWLELARAQGIDNVRFPGGTLSDFYHWRDGIGPVNKRPVTEHPTDTGRSPHVFGTPEFLRFCQAIGARPLITVNAGTASAQEAADWVAYCNQPHHPERKADGIAQPAGVKLWEIGNELYLPGNPTDKKIITIPPETYATRFLEFAAAMRSVDPSIKLMGIGSANAYAVPLPYPEWSEVLLKKAAGEMDYIAVHNAYYPMIFAHRGLGTKEVYQSLWAAPEAVNRSLDRLDALISRHEKDRRIEIAITEWGALFSMERSWVDHCKTLGSSVYLARLMQVFISQPRVSLTNYFKFTDRVMVGWVGYDQRPKVPYYVIQLFTQHFGTRLVASELKSPTFSVPQVGVTSAEADVPLVTSVASLDEAGKKLFVNLVNRSWDKIYPVKIDTGRLATDPHGTAWEISGPGVTDHNGPDVSEELPASLYQEPPLSPDAKSHIGIESREVDLTAPVLVPPHSIVTIELTIRS